MPDSKDYMVSYVLVTKEFCEQRIAAESHTDACMQIRENHHMLDHDPIEIKEMYVESLHAKEAPPWKPTRVTKIITEVIETER